MIIHRTPDRTQNIKWGQQKPVEDLFEKYECVREWLINVSKGSHHNYQFYMRKFIEFSGWTPDQILELAKEDLKIVHVKMKEFWYKLGDEDQYAIMTRSAAYGAVRSFLYWHSIQVGRTPREFHGEAQYEAYRILEPQEISLMLDYSRTARDQALITFLVQSGQRAGILGALRYGHVQDQLERGVNPIIITVTAEMLGEDRVNVNKGKVRYRFAIGKEAASFLRISLNHRRRLGEQINTESWLFRSRGRFDNRYGSDGRPIWKKVDDSDPSGPMKVAGIGHRVWSLAKRGGLDKVRPRAPGGRCVSHEIHPHIFRRFWKLQMRKAGVIDSDLLEYMMGHHNLRLRHGGSYDEFDPEYIRREYSKAEPYLTVTTDPVSWGAPTPWSPGVPVPRLENPRILPPGDKTPVINTKLRLAQSQRLVEEKELNKYFALGWQFVTTLGSGRVIISLLQ